MRNRGIGVLENIGAVWQVGNRNTACSSSSKLINRTRCVRLAKFVCMRGLGAPGSSGGRGSNPLQMEPAALGD